MATSEVSICNQALSWLGAKRITSLDENSRAANLCKANYELLRDAVLEERMWGFATHKAVSEVQDKDAWGMAFAHPIPAQFLGVFRVFKRIMPDGSGVPAEDWRNEEGNIVTRYSKIYLWGTKEVSDTKMFPSMFVQALAARIAADLCVPITENSNLQGDMWQLYGAKLTAAAARDGQQGGNDHITQTGLTSVRHISGSS